MPFTAAIIQRSFANTFDNALKLGGASYLRKITYGTGWQRIRIGALVSMTANGTSNIPDGVLTLGMCSGTTNPGSANVASSAIGYSFNGSPVLGSTRLLTYTANSGFPYYSCTTGVVYRKTPVAGYQVSATAGGAFLPLAYTGTQRRRFPIYVDIARAPASGAATITAYYVAVAGTAQIDFRPDHFQAGLDQIGTPTIQNTALSASTTISTMGFGDEFGPMDTFELFWSLNTFPIEIHAVGAVVINPLINSGTSLPYSASSVGGGFQVFSQYAPATQVISMTSAYGTGFLDGGTITGYSSGTLFINLPGTSGGSPVDNFEQYVTGSITSGVTLNAGTGWSGYGTIY